MCIRDRVQATLAAAELRDATAAQREKSIEMLRIKRAELQAQFEELSMLCVMSTATCYTLPFRAVVCPYAAVGYTSTPTAVHSAGT